MDPALVHQRIQRTTTRTIIMDCHTKRWATSRNEGKNRPMYTRLVVLRTFTPSNTTTPNNAPISLWIGDAGKAMIPDKKIAIAGRLVHSTTITVDKEPTATILP